MDKIGFLTFQNTTNYGSMLQAYALYKTISELNGNCEIINYSCPTIEKRELPLRLKDCRSPKYILKWLLCYHFSMVKYRKFCRFSEQYLDRKTKLYTKNNISEIAKQYDRVIVGSDIIWGLDITGNDFSYFLDFVKCGKKYAYAASFGHDVLPFSDNDVAKMKELIAAFDGISVRERSGINIVEELTGKTVPLVTDPTLLLTRNDWDILAETKPFRKPEKYILVYFAYDKKETFKLAKKLAKKTNCKIVYIHNSTLNYPGVENIKTAGVEEFLQYIKNAEYVISGSYHGLVFSLIYNKNFYYINRKYTARIKSLMQVVNLEERVFSEENIAVLKNIDYEPVNKHLTDLRSSSKDILSKFIYD